METAQLCQEIVEKSLQAFQEGLFTGTSGNMSVFLKEKNAMLITPTSVRYDEMRAEDIVTMNLDGRILHGELKPSSEWRMHAVIYKNFPEVKAVFHTHSPYATAFAVNHLTIPPVLVESFASLGGEIRCADYARPGTQEVGESAIGALQGRGGCILANHGVLAVGESLAQAYLRAEYIEEIAKISILARVIGSPIPLREL